MCINEEKILREYIPTVFKKRSRDTCDYNRGMVILISFLHENLK